MLAISLWHFLHRVATRLRLQAVLILFKLHSSQDKSQFRVCRNAERARRMKISHCTRALHKVRWDHTSMSGNSLVLIACAVLQLLALSGQHQSGQCTWMVGYTSGNGIAGCSRIIQSSLHWCQIHKPVNPEMHAEYKNVLWNGQAPAHYAGLGARQACQGEPGDTPNIMGKGKAIPWH
jgi:hypothetical protein